MREETSWQECEREIAKIKGEYSLIERKRKGERMTQREIMRERERLRERLREKRQVVKSTRAVAKRKRK